MENMENMLKAANSFNQTYAWCSTAWNAKKFFFGQTQKQSGRIFCCNIGSYLKDNDPYAHTGNYNAVVFPNGTLVNPSAGGLLQWKFYECPRCPAGQFTDSLNLAESCKTCPRNTIAPSKGLNSCGSCKLGKFSNNGLECESCDAGMYTLVGLEATECVVCSKGRFLIDGKKNQCKDCPFGWFNSDSGSSWCSNCLLGKYGGPSGKMYYCDWLVLVVLFLILTCHTFFAFTFTFSRHMLGLCAWHLPRFFGTKRLQKM